MTKYLSAIIFTFFMLASGALAISQADCQTLNPGLSAVNGVCVPSQTGLSEKPVKDIIVAVLGWLMGIFGFLGIIAFIVSGIMYLTAGGDAEQEKKAKKAMQMGIMGVIVGLAGFVIIQAIDTALNAGSLF